jgi:hypothetical protein
LPSSFQWWHITVLILACFRFLPCLKCTHLFSMR